jgi:hypothetical protein
MTQLPVWVQYLTAFSTPIIAGAVGVSFSCHGVYSLHLFNESHGFERQLIKTKRITISLIQVMCNSTCCLRKSAARSPSGLLKSASGSRHPSVHSVAELTRVGGRPHSTRLAVARYCPYSLSKTS